jgi:hypothetical protein
MISSASSNSAGNIYPVENAAYIETIRNGLLKINIRRAEPCGIFNLHALV